MNFFTLLFFTLFSTITFCKTINVCSPMRSLTVDPANAFDEISYKVLGLAGLTLFKKSGEPSRLLKNFTFNQETKTLELEINTSLKWRGNNLFTPPSSFSANDVLLSLTRALPKNQKTIAGLKNYIPFDMNVGQFIQKVEKKSPEKVLIIFKTASSDFKQILSHPNSSITSHEYLFFLQRKNSPNEINENLMTLQDSIFTRSDENSFTLTAADINYNFKLGIDLGNISSCDIILQLSKVEAQRISTLHKMHLKEEEIAHEIWMVFNDQRKFNTDPAFRRFIFESLKRIEATGELKTYGAIHLRSLSGEMVIAQENKSSSFELKTKASKMRKILPRTLMLYYPDTKSAFYTGGEAFKESILKMFKEYSIKLEDLPHPDLTYLKALSSGGFDLALIDTVDMKKFLSCFKPNSEHHPLRTCSDVSPASAAKDLLPAIPLFQFNYFSVSKERDREAFK